MQLPGGTAAAVICGPLYTGGGLSRDLRLAGISQLTCLQALLEAALPPAAGPTHTLDLPGELDVPPAAATVAPGSAAASRLVELRELRLGSGAPGTSVLLVLEALLPCCVNHLTCLTLRGEVGAQLPSCVVELHGLRSLTFLPNHELTRLPDGPYLSGEPAAACG